MRVVGCEKPDPKAVREALEGPLPFAQPGNEELIARLAGLALLLERPTLEMVVQAVQHFANIANCAADVEPVPVSVTRLCLFDGDHA